MSQKFLRLAALLALTFVVLSPGAWAEPPLEHPHVSDEVIIKFKSNASQHDKDLILADLNATHIKHLKRIKSDLKRVNSCSVGEAIGRYKNHPKVEFIEPNYIITLSEIPNDTRFGELWGMHNTGQTGGTPGADISATQAWDVFTGNSNIVVGVIDTGVDYNHSDLLDNAWVNPGEIANNGIDDDGNGYIDDVYGWDFINDDNDPMDDNGHGTHVSGTIGGVGNNGNGVAGVNWNVKVMGLKFLSASGSGNTADAIEAVEYATMMAQMYPGTIRLTSNSWGGGGYSQAMYDAIADAGLADMLFIAAAGNSSSNNDVSPHYPSNYDLANVISVAATDHNDNLASFSSYGATTVDLAAPGVDILSTFPGNAYGSASGTSMATPHVSGVAALTFGRFPAVSALDAKSLILNGVDPLANLSGIVLTGGRLNAFWPIAEPDSIPPAGVTDLATTSEGSNWVDLSWGATGDDGSTGVASRYDMRYSTAPIDELNWDSASQANNEPDPAAAGTLESMRVSGLDFSTMYYFAVKVLDEFGNTSPISNIASTTTLGAPDIATSPLSLSEALLTGGTSMQTLNLSNVGLGTLDFTIPSPTLLSAAVAAYTFVDVPKGGVDPREGIPAIAGSGGPDAYGYRWADSNDPFGPAFNWVDISGIGTLAMSTGDDTSAGPFAIGFDFPYYGAAMSEFRVVSNGFLSFSSTSTAYSNQPLPSAGAPAHMLAPFWDDLIIGTGSIYYYNDGTRLIVQWDEVQHYGSGGPYTFQAILYPDGTFEYQYLSMGAPLNSATVGWQNGDGSDGDTIVYNFAYVEDNLAIQVKALPQWLSVFPSEGTVFAPGSTNLDVSFDASGLLGGTYDGIIRILSNDPDESEYQVPVQLVVTGAPDITVTPASFDFGPLFLGAVGETDIIVTNTGTAPLSITGISIGDAAFVNDVSAFTLAPHAAQLVHVTFTPTLAQVYSTNMTITSDDPDEPSVVVALTGEGQEPPQFAIAPTSLTSNLLTGQTDAQTLTLTNSGGADFVWDMAIDFHTSVTVHEELVLGKDDIDTRASIPVTQGAGGPDLYGYRWVDSDEVGGPTYDWVDISSTGTPVWTSTADDVNSGPFPVGFSFPFYGNSFTEFRVSSNGFITFTGTASDYSNDPLPSAGGPPNLLALFWDDLRIVPGDGENVYYEYDGSRLIVQYDQVSKYYNSGSLTMQAILYPNGTIVYQYNTLTGASLTSATVGIQNETRDDGLTVVYNSAYLHDAMAIRFEATPEWLTASPSSGVIPPGGSSTITANFNATGLNGGTYTGDIVLNTNDPSVPTMNVPATLNVTGAPQMAVSATSFDFGSQFIGFPTLQNLVISNLGTDDLVISGVAFSQPEFTGNLTAPTTLGPTQSLLVNLNFVPSSAMTFNGTLTIDSNDATTPSLVIDLTGVGLVPPVAAVTPTSLASALFTGEQEIQHLTLTNSGGSDLDFEIHSELVLDAVVVYGSPDLGKEEVDTRPGILGSGGPDLFGYSWSDSDEPGGPVFDWVDISATGTPVFSTTADDRNSGPFPVGFSFPFYGNSFTEFRVSSNGWVSFTNTTTDLSNDPLPSSGGPENLLALFWDDLKVWTGNGENVYYEYDGTRLIIQYDQVSRYSSGGPYTMQAILYPSGTIIYQYLTMAGTRLDEATIGIQNDTRTDGLTIAFNEDYVHDNMAIRIAATPDWLSANPATGTVPPGGSADIAVRFNATELFGGAYDGEVRIQTNDPARGLMIVPAHLDVTGIPLFAADPTALDFGNVYLSLDATLPVTVSNPGSQTLIVTGVASDNPQFVADLAAFEVEPLQSKVVNVTFTPASAGTQSGNLSFTHDAASSPDVVTLTGVGVIPPEIVVAPTSIVGAALPGGSKVKTLQICNTGGSDLTFDLGAAEVSGASATVYDSPDLGKEDVDTRPGMLGSGGPDAFGYSWVDSDDAGGPTYNWVDISSIGTAVFSGTSDDVNTGPFPIGFNFSFYGNDFTEFRVSSNGFITFTGTASDFSNDPLPSAGGPPNLIALFWDDLRIVPGDGENVYYHNDGSRLIVQYDQVSKYFNTGTLTMQAILYPDGTIVYQYHTLSGASLTSVTVGIQNETRDDALQVVYNSAYLHENLAIEFSTGASWLSATPESGVIPAGECLDVTVTMSAAELAAGDYLGAINIMSNDLTDPHVEVPVTFHVGSVDAAETDVDPNTLNLGSHGKFMTVFTELPAGYDPAMVLIETVLFNGTVVAETSPFQNDADFNGNGTPDLMFKFDRDAIAALLPEGDEVEVVITGEIEDTIYFVARDTIRVINPSVMHPNGGEAFMAGSTCNVTWQNPDGWNVDHANIYYSSDDGVTWTEVATDIVGTSYQWTVPAVETMDARLRVFVYDNKGMLGYDGSDAVFELSLTATGIGNTITPRSYALEQNVPNPFNPMTTIRFDLPKGGDVNLSIYDVKGRLVRVLRSETMSAGSHEVTWNGIDERGQVVSSGVYFYRIDADDFQQTKRMLLMK